MVKTVRSFTFVSLQNAVDHQVASIRLAFEISRQADPHMNRGSIWEHGCCLCNTTFSPCFLVDMARYRELIACRTVIQDCEKFTKWLGEGNVAFSHIY